MSMVSCDVILAAGGSGTRFGGAVNKVLAELRGVPVLRYSLDLFGTHPAVRRVIIPCRPADREAVAALADAWKNAHADASAPEILLTDGGATRQASVYNALLLCCEPLVLIHDGARPFATAAMIDACLDALRTWPAVSTGVVSKDTVKLVNEAGVVLQTPDRAMTRLIQTPQGFRREELLAAHERFREIPVTDDCSLMELAGCPVRIVDGSYENIKITTPDDLRR
ncbi:MAG: 2-C-methyl-D-erythritol 4-phosphate cytidylyltransferase [Lachnospiraceae bacterium]|nr:2-C-methyl-D-erythritol 4-phosphate cytidylyltransferase [Lachnospiraceae bacterium]